MRKSGHCALRDAEWALGDLAGAGVPPLLRQVIDARVARLGDDAARLLAVAAVLGQAAPLLAVGSRGRGRTRRRWPTRSDGQRPLGC